MFPWEQQQEKMETINTTRHLHSLNSVAAPLRVACAISSTLLCVVLTENAPFHHVTSKSLISTLPCYVHVMMMLTTIVLIIASIAIIL